jgi:hypothetical protein
MSQMTFGVKVTSQDDTARGFHSVQSAFANLTKTLTRPLIIPWKLAGAGLGVMRDIQQGLRPAAQQVDQLIQKSTALEVTRKAFMNLTHTNAEGANKLGRSLVDASQGMMQLNDAFALGNRAMGAGMSLDQLGTAIEFISKKAIATGKDAKQSLDTVITGLSRGSTLFLDDFGILVDGVDGIKRGYDAIKGTGAWDALGPAAQKMETIRQALGEMQQQMGKLGISGRENVFTWAAIKNTIGDAVDEILAGVGRSQELSEALKEVRAGLAGISEYVRKGGSIWDVVFGTEGDAKKGIEGKAGLLGGLAAFAMDTGEILGRGIVAGVLQALGDITELLDRFQEWVKGLFPKSPLPSIGAALGKVWNAAKGAAVAAWQAGPTATAAAAPNGAVQGFWGMLEGFHRAGSVLFGNTSLQQFRTGTAPFDRAGSGWHNWAENNGPQPESLSDMFYRLSQEQLAQINGYGRTSKWRAKFAKSFPAPVPTEPAAPAAPSADRGMSALDPESYGYSKSHERQQLRERRALEHQQRGIERQIEAERQGGDWRGEAREVIRRRREVVAGLREGGRYVPREAYGGIEGEIRRQMREERFKRLDDLTARRTQVRNQAYEKSGFTDTRGQTDVDTAKTIARLENPVNRMCSLLEGLVGGVAGVLSELADVSASVGAMGSRRR